MELRDSDQDTDKDTFTCSSNSSRQAAIKQDKTLVIANREGRFLLQVFLFDGCERLDEL